ncbi:hypothetical protein [Jhaorihella thermophila]|uniref:Uncharacterized protein n=1 Tax=Jhaorihella thermophila TaxID=488547 RepID=A0A1H5WAQ2_9RHOB|nr:hypothetical protein [Jhaorihella thermophila]SEF96336.1 hypothetical protein SAMN05421751_107190 [Jhaorihella thermophila]
MRMCGKFTQPVNAARLGRAGLALVWIGLAAGCAQIPELAASINEDLRDSRYPALVPIDRAVVPLPAPEEEASELQSELDARRARLRRRAEAMLNEGAGG